MFFFFSGEAAIPGWAILVCVAVGELLVGGISYLIMKKIILDVPTRPSYTQARSSA